MPYSIQKSTKPRGWWVIKTDTNEKLHKKIHKTKREALQHLKALKMHVKHDDIGEGLFGDIKDNILGRISGFRNDYKPSIRKLLSKIGFMKIKNIVLYRQPVQLFVKKFLNILSLGSFQNQLQKRGFDEVFHLYARIDLNDYLGNQLSIRIEKNHVINISVWNSNDEVKNKMNLLMPNETWNKIGGLTLNQFLDNTKKLMGDKYFKYSAFWGNNCQNFILSMLQANYILDINPQAKNFIYQDIGTLGNEIGIAGTVSQKLTDIASIGDTLIYGKGFY